jgi:hypothetical protein
LGGGVGERWQSGQSGAVMKWQEVSVTGSIPVTDIIIFFHSTLFVSNTTAKHTFSIMLILLHPHYN